MKEVTENNYYVGAKVVRNPDTWTYGNQDEGSIYGVIKGPLNGYPGWVEVTWIGNDKYLRTDNYEFKDLLLLEEPFDIDQVEAQLTLLEEKIKTI